jgi:hypothetical protein
MSNYNTDPTGLYGISQKCILVANVSGKTFSLEEFS